MKLVKLCIFLLFAQMNLSFAATANTKEKKAHAHKHEHHGKHDGKHKHKNEPAQKTQEVINHGGHSHGGGKKLKAPDSRAKDKKITEKEAKEIGRERVGKLIADGKIAANWKKIKPEKAEIKEFNGAKEWVVNFKNEKGIKGKTLYVFLSLKGMYITANFSGN